MTPPLTDRPACLPGQTLALDTHCGRLYVTVNRDPGTGLPVEVFCRFGKAGGCGSAVMDGLTRMISYGLRSGLAAEDVVDGLRGIACHRGAATCMDAVARGVAMVLAANAEGKFPSPLAGEGQGEGAVPATMRSGGKKNGACAIVAEFGSHYS